MNPNSIIPQSDDRLLSYFLKETVVGLFGNNNKNGKSDDNYIFILLGLIMVVATEPFKVLLRKNIGKLSLSILRLVVAVFIYLLWALLIFGIKSRGNYDEVSGALQAGIVFYVLFATSILFLGISEFVKAKQHYNANPNDILTHIYRGDSIYFKGDEQQKIWLKKEPLACFIVSLLLTALPAYYNPILAVIGAPLLATAISFWFNEWFQISNVWDIQTRRIQLAQIKSEQKQAGFETEDFNSVTAED